MNNNKKFFTVGPAQIHNQYMEFYGQAISQNLGSYSHRSAQFHSLYQFTDIQLRSLLHIPTTHSIYFGSSASELMEATLLNLVASTSVHFVNGAFANKWYQYARALGKQSIMINANTENYFDNKLQVELPQNTELACVTLNETSTGINLPFEEIINLKALNPNTTIALDIVSIAPCCSIDFNVVDVAFFSVQKAFGMPPGLGVWIVNKNCIEKAKYLKSKGINIGANHNLISFDENYKNFETPCTPNILAIYVLGKIAECYNETGFNNLNKENERKATLLYNMQSNSFKPNTTQAKYRSKTTILFNTSIDAKHIIQQLDKQGMAISSGYKSMMNAQIRIANFPTTSYNEMLDLCNALHHIV